MAAETLRQFFKAFEASCTPIFEYESDVFPLASLKKSIHHMEHILQDDHWLGILSSLDDVTQKKSAVSSLQRNPAFQTGYEEIKEAMSIDWSKVALELCTSDARSNSSASTTLGRGTYGVVSRVRTRETGQIIAVKSIDKRVVLESLMTTQVENEISFQARARHPNLLRCYGWREGAQFVHIFLECCDRGDLYQKMKAKPTRRFSEDEAFVYFMQLINGLAYMHWHGFFHRDLKLENLLVGSDDDETLRIADFGWIGRILGARANRNFCGTLDYLCPEMIYGAGHDWRADIWSAGVLLYEMIVGTPPFHALSAEGLLRNVLSNSLTFPKWVSLEAQELIKNLLTSNPDLRTELPSILAFPWIKKQWDVYVRRQIETSQVLPLLKSVLNKGLEMKGVCQKQTSALKAVPSTMPNKEATSSGPEQKSADLGTKTECVTMTIPPLYPAKCDNDRAEEFESNGGNIMTSSSTEMHTPCWTPTTVELRTKNRRPVSGVVLYDGSRISSSVSTGSESIFSGSIRRVPEEESSVAAESDLADSFASNESQGSSNVAQSSEKAPSCVSAEGLRKVFEETAGFRLSGQQLVEGSRSPLNPGTTRFAYTRQNYDPVKPREKQSITAVPCSSSSYWLDTEYPRQRKQQQTSSENGRYINDEQASDMKVNKAKNLKMPRNVDCNCVSSPSVSETPGTNKSCSEGLTAPALKRKGPENHRRLYAAALYVQQETYSSDESAIEDRLLNLEAPLWNDKQRRCGSCSRDSLHNQFSGVRHLDGISPMHLETTEEGDVGIKVKNRTSSVRGYLASISTGIASGVISPGVISTGTTDDSSSDMRCKPGSTYRRSSPLVSHYGVGVDGEACIQYGANGVVFLSRENDACSTVLDVLPEGSSSTAGCVIPQFLSQPGYGAVLPQSNVEHKELEAHRRRLSHTSANEMVLCSSSWVRSSSQCTVPTTLPKIGMPCGSSESAVQDLLQSTSSLSSVCNYDKSGYAPSCYTEHGIASQPILQRIAPPASHVLSPPPPPPSPKYWVREAFQRLGTAKTQWVPTVRQCCPRPSPAVMLLPKDHVTPRERAAGLHYPRSYTTTTPLIPGFNCAPRLPMSIAHSVLQRAKCPRD